MTSIILVEKSCTVKCLTVKTLCEDELYKKCGFKKPDGFECAAEWCVKLGGVKRILLLYGKTSGRANAENKYDFPPPADNLLFFGTCAVTCKDKATGDDKMGFINKCFAVWNVAQIEGLEGIKTYTPPAAGTGAANRLAESLGINLQYGGDRACFIPSADVIKMPSVDAFKDEAFEYNALLNVHK